MWRDTRDLILVLDLSSLVLTDMPLSADILRDYTLEFEIRVERALVNLRECLREAVRDKDYFREIANTLMEDIKEISSMQENELATFKVELNRKRLALLNIEAEYIQLRSWVAGLEDRLTDLTWSFATLDHTWDKERVALEAGRADGLALELVQARSCIHSTLSMEYGREGHEPSEL